MERRRSIVSSALIAIACAVPQEGQQSAQSLGQEGSSTDEPDVTTTTTTDDPTSAATTQDSTDPVTSSAESEGPGPACGNGVLDVGEVCDDGNDLDADGCNVDCRPSGELVFEHVFDPAPLGHEMLRGIDHAADGTYVVGGDIVGTSVDAWAARLTQDDELMWDLPLVVNPYDDIVFGVAAGEGGRTYAAGVIDQLSGIGDPWVAAIAPAGAIEASDRIALAPHGRFFAIADAGDGVVVVGHQDEALVSHGIIRFYSPDLVLQTELEPVVASTGLTMRDACPNAGALLAVGHRHNAAATIDGFVAMLDASSLQWLRTTQAQQGQNSIALACAVSGDGEDRRLWSAGYDSAAAPRWLATLKAYAVGGTVAIDVPTYVGEDDLGAFWSDVSTDAAGNVIVGGGTVVGPGDTEYVPVVRKLDPDGVTLWTRTLVPGGYAFGSIDAVDVSPEGAIRVGGWAADATGLRRRWLARLTP